MTTPTMPTSGVQITPGFTPAVEFTAPALNPSPGGLYPVANITEVDGPSRFLAGVRIWPFNCSTDAAGLWLGGLCTTDADDDPEPKSGTRAQPDEPFEPLTVYGWDECDYSDASRRESEQRAIQALRINEPQKVEREYAARLLLDAGNAIKTAADIVSAIGGIEEQIAATGLVGYLHLRASWAASMAQANLITRTGSTLKSPLGNTLVFGGGYGPILGDKIIATTQPFVWRDAPVTRTHELSAREANQFVLAERSVVVGHECLLGAVNVTG